MTRRRAAITLLETLFVAVLLALLAAAGAVALGGPSEEAALRAAVAEAADLDRRGRLLALAGERTELRIREDRAALLADGVAPGAGRTTPEGVAATLLDATRRPLDAVVFDAAGRSRDYVLRLARGQRRAELHVAGATGWWEVR